MGFFDFLKKAGTVAAGFLPHGAAIAGGIGLASKLFGGGRAGNERRMFEGQFRDLIGDVGEFRSGLPENLANMQRTAFDAMRPQLAESIEGLRGSLVNTGQLATGQGAKMQSNLISAALRDLNAQNVAQSLEVTRQQGNLFGLEGEGLSGLANRASQQEEARRGRFGDVGSGIGALLGGKFAGRFGLPEDQETAGLFGSLLGGSLTRIFG
jgi:hypothetical protein